MASFPYEAINLENQLAMAVFFNVYKKQGLLPKEWSKSDFLAQFGAWSVIPVKVHKKIVGAFLLNGPEVHAGVLPAYQKRWVTRALLDASLNQTIQKFGYVCTKVKRTDDAAFPKRLGFTFWKNDGDLSWYWRTDPWTPKK